MFSTVSTEFSTGGDVKIRRILNIFVVVHKTVFFHITIMTPPALLPRY